MTANLRPKQTKTISTKAIFKGPQWCPAGRRLCFVSAALATALHHHNDLLLLLYQIYIGVT